MFAHLPQQVKPCFDKFSSNVCFVFVKSFIKCPKIISGSFRELVEYLNDSGESLAKNSNILDNVLETLDMQQHSLGVLYILVTKISEIQVRLRIHCLNTMFIYL